MQLRCSVADVKCVVKVSRVSKTFTQANTHIHALKDVSLETYQNELLMIVGPSGCGKTTLLSVIAGTLRFDSGSIELFGAPLETLSESEITAFRRKNIGFIFQQFHLIPTLSCAENIAIPLLLNGHTRHQSLEAANKMLTLVGLKERGDNPPRKLSGGEQQRVAIARAIVHHPKLIICDEPTSALDAETGHKIMILLANIAKEEDRSVIVVTHDNRIFEYANRITQMNDGQIMAVKTQAALQSNGTPP